MIRPQIIQMEVIDSYSFGFHVEDGKIVVDTFEGFGESVTPQSLIPALFDPWIVEALEQESKDSGMGGETA